MEAVGKRARGAGTIFLVGGATAVLRGWRHSTIDVDIKADPEPAGLFEAIAAIKNELDINVELASPDHFIPPLPGWRDRSLFVTQCNLVAFYHYDPYGQALSKLARRHDRDLRDVRSMLADGLIGLAELWNFFERIEPQLIRYPALDALKFRAAVFEFVSNPEGGNTP